MNQGANTPIWTIGPVKVLVPGTLVGLLDAYPQFKRSAGAMTSPGGGQFTPGQTEYKCHKIGFTVDPSNVGRMYVGTKGFVRATRAGMIYPFPAGNLLSTYSWDLTIPGSRNDIAPEDYYVDADTANDQLIVVAYMVGSR